jgi:transposase InsO family protein
MPWKECVTNEVRGEFVQLAMRADANLAALCRRFGISRRCGYKWLKRFRAEGQTGLLDRSRRPHASPAQVDGRMRQAVVRLRMKHPVWGGRKLRKLLENQGRDPATLPAVSTIGRILFRGGLIDPARSSQHRAFQRFEHDQPNDLWQMDFKGHFALGNGRRCHALTVLDDHSRYCLCLQACTGETEQDVKPALVRLFQQNGLPLRILCDNGPPWGTWHGQERQGYTRLGLWLLRQDVGVCHGRPRHPQTQGKDERLHRTLKEELLMRQPLANMADAQKHFDPWREQYNCVRPHEALGLAVPASRYGKSPRAYEPDLKMEYLAGDQVRKVDRNGLFAFRSIEWRLGIAFAGETVAIRSTAVDGMMAVIYARQIVAGVNLKEISRGRRRVVCCAEPPVAALPPTRHSTQKVLPMS